MGMREREVPKKNSKEYSEVRELRKCVLGSPVADTVESSSVQG